jgi:hypothetical protein
VQSPRATRRYFQHLPRRYVHRVFNEQLAPKKVAGRLVTAPQLGRYIRAYCGLFQERRGLPEAKMLLEATTEASNRIAVDEARGVFEDAVARAFRGPFLSDAEMRRKLDAAADDAMGTFDEVRRRGTPACGRR